MEIQNRRDIMSFSTNKNFGIHLLLGALNDEK